MSAQVIGSVKGGKTKKSFEVKWDASSRDVYVNYAGWTNCGKASSAGDAMNRAEAAVFEK